MPSLSPRSMPALVITGLLIVTLPLASAVLIGIVYVDRLLEQTEHLVEQGVEVTRQSRLLQEQVRAMERSARQYQVLGDPSLITLYEKHQASFLKTLDVMETFELKGVAQWNLEQMREDSRLILRSMTELPSDTPELGVTLDNFSRMSELAEGMAIQGNEFIDSELDRLTKTADNARRYLAWSIAAVLPGVALLIILFTFILSRPLRLLSRAIHDLGKGQLNKTIRIKGPPEELQALGDQLEWLRAQLRAINQERDTFLRNMSHELKTPLASIRESTELLNDGTLGNLTARQQEVVGLLRDNGQELESLIENLLYLNATQETGALSRPEHCDLTGLIHDVVNRHRLLVDSKGLRVRIFCTSMQMTGDPLKLRMAINNLVSNAIKYSPPGGSIRIRGRTNAKNISLDIEDEGPGIPEEERMLVFQPFYQGGQRHDSHLRGTGIGLSVVRACIEAHQGRIEIVDSVSGAHFRIDLPIHGQQESN